MDRHITTERHYICIEGTIGAGKTTLCRELAKREDVLGPNPCVQLEPAEQSKGGNPYLSDYYADPNRWAFEMQLFLLISRFNSQLVAQDKTLAGECSVIADRSYFGDRCFAEVQNILGTMDDRSFRTYLMHHKRMQCYLLYPSAMVWLHVDPELALKRIAKRRSEIEGRQCEAGIDIKYMTLLDEAISRMMESMRSYTNVIDIYPFNADGTERTPKEISDLIINAISGTPRRYDAWQGIG